MALKPAKVCKHEAIRIGVLNGEIDSCWEVKTFRDGSTSSCSPSVCSLVGNGTGFSFKTCGKSVQAFRDLAAKRQPDTTVRGNSFGKEEFLWKFLTFRRAEICTSKRRRSDFYFHSTRDTLTLVIAY